MPDPAVPPQTIEIRGKSWTLVDATSRLYRRTWATSYGSSRYGSCEVCRKSAETVWCADFAVALRLDGRDEVDGVGPVGSWVLTHDGAPGSIWGHRECVEARKAQP